MQPKNSKEKSTKIRSLMVNFNYDKKVIRNEIMCKINDTTKESQKKHITASERLIIEHLFNVQNQCH